MIWFLAYIVIAGIIFAVAWHEIAPSDPGAVFPFPKWPKVLAISLLWPGVAVFWVIDKLRGST